MPRRLLQALVLAILLSALDATASDLYFYLTDSEPLCFLDDMAEGATLLVKFSHQRSSTMPAVVQIHDPNGVLQVEKKLTESGRLALAAKLVGEHRICVMADPVGKAWPAASKSAKISLKIDIVSSTVEVADANLAKVSHVKGLESELNDLASVVDLVLKDMELARQRETHFRDQNERINSRVVWWSVIQTLVLVVAATIQSLSLHAFFVAKKIA